MSKKKMTKQELLDNREELLEQYQQPHKSARKRAVLTKKERKVLGIGKDQGKATIKDVRISPYKVAPVCNIVRGKDLREAKAILTYTPKASCPVLLDLLKTAAANAVNNNGLDPDRLYVADLIVGQGPTMKRWQAAGRGSARPIAKRTCQITAIVKERA